MLMVKGVRPRREFGLTGGVAGLLFAPIAAPRPGNVELSADLGEADVREAEAGGDGASRLLPDHRVERVS